MNLLGWSSAENYDFRKLPSKVPNMIRYVWVSKGPRNPFGFGTWYPKLDSWSSLSDENGSVGCQEDKVKGTAGPLFTTFHDHLTSCGPNDFDECRKIYWFYWLRIHTPSIKAWDWDFVQIFPAQWPVSRRLPPNSSFLRASKLQCGPPR